MSPQILERNVEGHLKPTVKFLIEEVGLSKDRLPKAINRCPRLLVCGLDEQLRHTMRFLSSLGFKGMEWVVSSNPALLTFSIQKKLVPKLQFLQSLGITHEEAVGMVIRLPAIFNYSLEGNLRVKHEYLINVMRRDLDELCCFPQFFAFSLDHRIRPRHEFLSKHNVRLSLPTMLKLGNKEFSAMFTKGAPKYMMTHDGFFLE
ncbi:hypothetical protein O6H91_11G070600 [Diphasiastrum complanatum]|nr:hypothetical protein O6H91_11G070600 [Diphasiastrum complanatum]